MKDVGMVPVLTTEGGLCLTMANWQEAHVGMASCHLDALLMKPGLDILFRQQSLASYFGSPMPLALNAHTLFRRPDCLFEVRSLYDGRTTRITLETLFDLIVTLAPTAVILPKDLGALDMARFESLPETIMPFIHASTLNRSHGVCFAQDDPVERLGALRRHRIEYPDKPCYMTGEVHLSLMFECFEQGASFVETDKPAYDGDHGIAYGHEGEMDISSADFAHQYTPLDERCSCHTCSHHLTKAYLHHLWHHTPLLCQRFLVQHNVVFVMHWISRKVGARS